MKLLAHFIPAKEHDSNKSCFHKKSDNTFNSQRSSKYISYKPRVIAPVGTELKFQNQSGGNSHGKVYSEQLHPELSRPLPKFISGNIIKRFH